jgi:nitrogen fixation protein FixH
MTKPFTGRHAAAILVAFFAVVIAVNMLMATLATRTFGGVVVENSYVASQHYNRWLAEARRQEQLGWSITPSLDGSRHVVVAVDVPAPTITGVAVHPLGRAEDIRLNFDANGRSLQAMPPGRWAVHLLVRKGEDEARVIEMLR